MAPFAENTTQMVGEFQARVPSTWVYLKPYQNRPSAEAAREAAKPLTRIMGGVALYSMQVTALNDARLSDERKAQELARYIVEVVRPGIAAGHTSDVGVTLQDLDAIIAEIRKKHSLLDAIAAAQPLVNAVVVSANKLLGAYESAVEAARRDVAAAVEEKFAPLTENLKDVERIQMQTVRSFALVTRLRLGEEGALELLLENDPDLRAVSPAGKPPGPGALDAAEKRLVDRLERIKAVRDQLAPEFAFYMENQRELETIHARAVDHARWTRATLGLWARSHRNLGAGVPVPPSVDVLGFLGRTTERAVGSVIP